MSILWKLSSVHSAQESNDSPLADITLEIKVGEKVALIGPQKGGRAALFKVLAGLRPRQNGDFSCMNRNISLLARYADWEEIFSREIRRKMGVAFEKEGLLSNVSVREGLELLFRFRYGDHNEKLCEGAKRVVEALCLRFGLNAVAELRPSLLTSTERKQAALARAFLAKPLVVMLENPTQDVGDLGRGAFVEMIRDIFQDSDRSVVVSTEDFELAQEFCTRWILIDEGRIVFDGSPDEFLGSGLAWAQRISHLIREAA